MTKRTENDQQAQPSFLETIRAEEARFAQMEAPFAPWLAEAMRRLGDEVESTGAATPEEHQARLAAHQHDTGSASETAAAG